jgi:hypothetical protein
VSIRPHHWLVVLSLVPVIAGVVRLAGLALGGPASPADQRFVDQPLPVALHIVCASLYCIAGAFQFDAGLRSRRPGWHRGAGWLAAPCGVGAAGSGVWMALNYAIPEALQGNGLMIVRAVVGAAMGACLVLAILAVLRRRIPSHRAWSVRAYALAQGAGTQVLLFIAVAPFTGELTGAPRDLVMSLAWVLNLAVAETLLARSGSGRAADRGATATQARASSVKADG